MNNAGMAHYTSVGETTPEVYDEVMDTNARSHVFLTQLALPHLIKTKGNHFFMPISYPIVLTKSIQTV